MLTFISIIACMKFKNRLLNRWSTCLIYRLTKCEWNLNFVYFYALKSGSDTENKNMKKLAYTNVNAEASMLKQLRSLEDVIPELLMSGLRSLCATEGGCWSHGGKWGVLGLT